MNFMFLYSKFSRYEKAIDCPVIGGGKGPIRSILIFKLNYLKLLLSDNQDYILYQ